MRKSFVALLLLFGAAASMANLALAQSADELNGDIGNKLVTKRSAQARNSNSARQSLARINRTQAACDSIWIGQQLVTMPAQCGRPAAGDWSPNHIGQGLNLPNAANATTADKQGNSGLWDWDHLASTDSLQGWWPMRRAYGITGGLTMTDLTRPWWAIDIGNEGNYAVNGSAAGTHPTRGVLSYWHVDGGSSATQVRIAGTNALAMTWAPITGAGSAWCGLRAHGDITYLDGVTNNPYNAMVLEFNGENGAGAGVGTSKKYPGYPSQMDQILYADVVIASGASLDLSFAYRTAMSSAASATASDKTGWFEYDPTFVGTVQVTGPNSGAPNFVPSAGTPPQPADSFMVYIGVPVRTDGSDDAPRAKSNAPVPVYDVKRRWMSEVVDLRKPIRQVLSAGGDNSTTFTLSGADKDMSAFYNAQTGGTRYARIVFRTKTNRGFDDNSGSNAGAYSSGGKGAVLVDDVAVAGTGVSSGVTGTTTFDTAGDINNSVDDDLVLGGKWRATGKPPAVYFHTHPLLGDVGRLYDPLVYQDICGDQNADPRFCNVRGVVISAGDHDFGERAGADDNASPEREVQDGMLSPTILLASSGVGDYNAIGLDADGAEPLDDYYVWYDLYAGVFNLNFTGNAWTLGFQSYPSTQADGVNCWGEIIYPGFQIFNPDIQCFQDVESEGQFAGVVTSNVSGIPDSIRMFLGKNQQCFRFAVTGLACSSRNGAYFDNVSFLISDDAGGGGSTLTAQADIWRWINDAFPSNTSVGLSGTAAFDTAAAYLKTGINISQGTTSVTRFDIPGDSIIIISTSNKSCTKLGRLDMVFRIKPGVGNYHTVGDPNSGLRPVPTDPTNIVASGDANFWGMYLASPGYMGNGVHGNPAVALPGGQANWWNRNVWNSARCDTAEVNIYRITGKTGSVTTNFNNHFWMATYHEGANSSGSVSPAGDDQVAKYTTLGILHNRCFLTNPAGSNVASNTKCDGSVPSYAPVGYSGTTTEGTKIIPDGQLTAGAHVEYFFRAQDDGSVCVVCSPSSAITCNPVAGPVARNDNLFAMVPETTYVSPQNNEGSSDGHRWQQFGILPDRWKDAAFNDTPKGTGMACMLYVDQNDRRGNERQWVGVADSIGATAANRRGAHNGWRANGGTTPYADANGGAINISTNPSIAVYTHGGQPGTTWDMYGVKASESLTTSAGALGSRLSATAIGTIASGKESKQGPSAEMLKYYYPVLMFLTGDLVSGIWGRFINRSQDDVTLVNDFLTDTPTGTGLHGNTTRAILIQGDGFVQSEWAAGGSFADHLALLSGKLGTEIRVDGVLGPVYSYQPYSLNTADYSSLTTMAGGIIPGNVYQVGNACTFGNDVLKVNASVSGAIASAKYADAGSVHTTPYVASVYVPVITGTRFYESLVDGWDIEHLYSVGAVNSVGRIDYWWRVFNQVAASIAVCAIADGSPPLDVTPGGDNHEFVDFVALRNNPMLTGRANVHFGLAKADRVTARVFDVSGRLVRTLVDRNFPAGEHDLYWDGTDDGGRQMERGVYFTQVRYAKTRFTDAKKITVLK